MATNVLRGADLLNLAASAADSRATSRAITGTLLPPAEARITIARRSRTADPVPRRVIRSSR